jgi:hypothetical protein
MQKQARLEGVGQLNKSVRNYLRSAIRREVLKPTSMRGCELRRKGKCHERTRPEQIAPSGFPIGGRLSDAPDALTGKPIDGDFMHHAPPKPSISEGGIRIRLAKSHVRVASSFRKSCLLQERTTSCPFQGLPRDILLPTK